MSNEYKDWFYDIMTALNAKMYDADLLPDGWTKTFIPKMKEELTKVLGDYVYDFVVFQIKEKHGTMRMYWSWADRKYTSAELVDLAEISEAVNDIIRKYENISEKTCVVCGETATKMTTGCVIPVCDTHEYL